MSVILFTAPWCPTCKTVKPWLLELYPYTRVIDVEKDPDMATIHNIMSLPTILVMNEDVEVDKLVGGAPKHAIESFLKFTGALK